MPRVEGTANAPEFPSGMEWLNTSRPLTLKELRGKVVLLDFWTYCCINCMHILPTLKKLEHKYRQELVVIGVHSAKFTTEKETENIRQAILRYEIEHPVVNDRDMIIWRRYMVRAWPTFFLIDPRGKIIGSTAGEVDHEALDEFIGRVIKAFDERGLIDRRPVRFHLERDRTPTSLLSFPGKVLADEASDRLFVADSNHHRIVVATLAGRVIDVIGRGEMGFEDGSFEQAMFNHPQGLALDGDILYIADTDNHAIRRADLKRRRVITLAGTGEQARGFRAAGVGSLMPLNSPWDLIVHDGALYIAMAGWHQLWKMDLKTLKIEPYAGSGREARIDGPLRQAALAQPSGITTDGDKLYFADSEASAIRSADLDPRGRVETIVGLDLFEFGDRDGIGSRVRLQHPLGIAYHDGLLYVADTYNNKIKSVDPRTRRATTLWGTGEADLRDGRVPLFDEPGGVSVAGGKLYIADTNNHVIRVADLKTKSVSTLMLVGLERWNRRMPREEFPGEKIALEPHAVRPGRGRLTISLALPDGYKLNRQAPSRVRLSVQGTILRFEDGRTERTIENPQFPLAIPVQVGEGEAHLTIALVIYYCQVKREALCYFKEVEIHIPIRARPSASTSDIKATYVLRITSPSATGG